MTNTLRKKYASSCRIQRLFLLGLLTVLISPTLTTADVIFHDTFDDLMTLSAGTPVWSQDWNTWISQGYDGTNDAPPDPVPCPTCNPPEQGGSIRGCNVDNPLDDCGPDDVPTVGGFHIPFPRPLDEPGTLTTGVRGWSTLRKDPVNPNDPPGCDPELDECGPCDPATQDCWERHDGTLRIEGIDLSNVEQYDPNGDTSVNPGAGVEMGLMGRHVGLESGTDGFQQSISGVYHTAFCSECSPAIYFQEFLYSTRGSRVAELGLPGLLDSPIHMELTLEGDNMSFTVGDEDEEYTITMVNGEHVHNFPQLPVDHTRPIPDPGRWGMFSHAGGDPGLSGEDWTYWGDFCFTDVGETCGAQTQPGDHDGDGDVDGNDFLGSQLVGASAISDWGPNYGVAASSGVAAVPEPSTFSLCALAAFALWPTRRQRV